MRQGAKAFTLVELSIVLVLLGLVVGGVLSGRAMIKASELRNVIRQQQAYQTALVNFKNKYNALPGDMVDASTFWGLQSTDTNTCLYTAPTGTATCNGDGDGHINYDYESVSAPYEMFRVWQHLSNAGFIEGQYTGAGFGVHQVVPGVGAPKGTFPNSVWGIWYAKPFSGGSGWAPNSIMKRHIIVLGGNLQAPTASETGYNARWHMPLFTTEDMYHLDQKLDDGLPHTGKVVDMAGISGTTHCETDLTATNATYDLTYTPIACVFMVDAGL